jgi:tRNA 2-thiouridine synthesizing protein D
MSSSESVTIVLGSSAYQSERAFTALNFAQTATLEGMKVKIFLFEDGVFLGKKGQEPGNFKNAEEWLKKVIADGAEVRACGTCIKERGVSEKEFIEGVVKGTMHDMVSWIRDTDKAVFF